VGGASLASVIGGSGVGSISLPFAELARSELAVTLVAVGQTGAFDALLAAWFVVVLRPNREPAASRRPSGGSIDVARFKCRTAPGPP
jgi:hypothetical protein